MVVKNVDGKRDHFPFGEVSGGRSQSARMRVAANSRWATSPGLFFSLYTSSEVFLDAVNDSLTLGKLVKITEHVYSKSKLLPNFFHFLINDF